MKLFKKKKRLEEIECPDIKGCGSKNYDIFSPCRNEGYTGCAIYLSNRKSEEEKQ